MGAYSLSSVRTPYTQITKASRHSNAAGGAKSLMNRTVHGGWMTQKKGADNRTEIYSQFSKDRLNRTDLEAQRDYIID